MTPARIVATGAAIAVVALVLIYAALQIWADSTIPSEKEFKDSIHTNVCVEMPTLPDC